MRVLIVDSTAEGQATCARRIESFRHSDVEMLDLRVKLVLDRDIGSQIRDADVLILGSGLGIEAAKIAKNVRTQIPWLHILMFVSEEVYASGSFREAYSAGVRKVLPDNAASMDLLQELIGIYTEFRKEGRIREGRLVCVTHAKGGTGATSICAALAEVCSVNKRRTLLWDLDVETRDLCRSLTVNGAEAKIVSSWINGSTDISRDSVCDALIPVSPDVSVLMPPDSMAEAMDMVCHTDGMQICNRIVEIARVLHDTILIDTGGRMGPATGALIRAADEVLIVIDDTVLGLTALDLFLSYVKALVSGPEKISFLVNGYSGSLLAVPQIEAELEPVHQLGPSAWRLPPVPVDAKASLWPGSGRTLYSMGQRSTRAALEGVAAELSLIPPISASSEDVETKGGTSWWERLLPHKQTEDVKEIEGA